MRSGLPLKRRKDFKEDSGSPTKKTTIAEETEPDKKVQTEIPRDGRSTEDKPMDHSHRQLLFNLEQRLQDVDNHVHKYLETDEGTSLIDDLFV